MGIGKQLKAILKKMNMSIAFLSKLSGISVNTLYSITKKDPSSINTSTLQSIAAALGCHPLELFDESDNYVNVLFEEVGYALAVANMTNKLKSISCNLIDEGFGSYSILCSDGEIHVNIDELDELNKETDEFLEFKLNQLKTRSHFIEYASSEEQKEGLPDDQEGNDDTTE